MKRLPKEDRAGLYITVIFNLTVIIVLLASNIGKVVQREQSFILDFSKQEKIEKMKEEIKFKEDVNRKLRALLEGTESAGEPVRNISVDRSKLKDSKGIDAEQLYKEAERVQREMKANQKAAAGADDIAEPELKPKQDKPKVEETYSGATVLSWNLDGRHLTHKEVPAYKCRAEGTVTVIIGVSPNGKVEIAEIQDEVSSSDRCLRREAIEAAKASRFSSKPDAPARQMGDITYQFIAQR